MKSEYTLDDVYVNVNGYQGAPISDDYSVTLQLNEQGCEQRIKQMFAFTEFSGDESVRQAFKAYVMNMSEWPDCAIDEGCVERFMLKFIDKCYDYVQQKNFSVKIFWNGRLFDYSNGMAVRLNDFTVQLKYKR